MKVKSRKNSLKRRDIHAEVFGLNEGKKGGSNSLLTTSFAGKVALGAVAVATLGSYASAADGIAGNMKIGNRCVPQDNTSKSYTLICNNSSLYYEGNIYGDYGDNKTVGNNLTISNINVTSANGNDTFGSYVLKSDGSIFGTFVTPNKKGHQTHPGTNNTVTINGTANVSGSVYGAYANTTKTTGDLDNMNAHNNSVTLSGKSNSERVSVGGDAAGAFAAKQANSNKLNSTFANVKGNVIGGLGFGNQAAATYNTVSLTNSSVGGSVIGGFVNNIYANSLLNGNKVSLLNSNVSYLSNGVLEGYGAFGAVAKGSSVVSQNSLTLSNSYAYITGYKGNSSLSSNSFGVNSMMTGGYSMGTGSVQNNTLSITNNSTVVTGGTSNLQDYGFLGGGLATGGNVTGNTLLLNASTIQGVSSTGSLAIVYVSGGAQLQKNASFLVANNTLSVINGTINLSAIQKAVLGQAAFVTGGYAANGTTIGNKINVTGTSKILADLIGGFAGSGLITAANSSNFGGKSEGNSVSVGSGAQVSGSVVGGLSVKNASVKNQVNVSGVTVDAGVFGGLAGTGNSTKSEGNIVTISKTNITGKTQNIDYYIHTGLRYRVGGAAIAGFAVTGNVTANSINLTDSETANVIAGGASGLGFVNQNNVSLKNVTTKGAVFGGNVLQSVLGAVMQIPSGAHANKVVLENSSVLGGATINLNASNNQTAYVTEGNVFGGIGATGGAGSNAVEVKANSTIGGTVLGGGSFGGNSTNNSVRITGESKSNSVLVKGGVFGGLNYRPEGYNQSGKLTANTATNKVSGNKLVLKNVNVSGETRNITFAQNAAFKFEVGGTVGAGLGYGNVTASENEVIAENISITGSLISGGALAGNVSGNRVNATNAQVGGNIYGGFNINASGSTFNKNVSTPNPLYSSANSNIVELSGVNVTGAANYSLLGIAFDTEGNVMGGYAGSGGASSNKVSLTDNSVKSVVSGSVIGGASFFGAATSNNLTISGQATDYSVVKGGAFGGLSFANAVRSNIVKLSNINLTGETKTLTFGRGAGGFEAGGSVAGGFAYGPGEAVKNEVEITNASVAGSVIGGWSVGGNASQNKVNLTNAAISGNIYAGVSNKSANLTTGKADNNTLVLSNVSVKGGANVSAEANGTATVQAGTVYGGNSFDGSASFNSVTVTNNSSLASDVIGGLAEGKGDAKNNTVVVSNAQTYGYVVGGWANGTGEASGNVVNISNSVINTKQQGTAANINASAITSLNQVAVIGGYSKNGVAKDNAINIVNSTIYGHICVAYQEKQSYSSVAGNKAQIDGNLTDPLAGNVTRSGLGGIKVVNSTIRGSFLRICGQNTTTPNNQVAIAAVNSSFDSMNVSGNLTNATITNSNVTNATINTSEVGISNLTNATINNSVVGDSNITASNANNSTLTRDNITNSNVTNSNVTLSNVSNSNLSNSNISNSSLSQANVSNSNLTNSNATLSNITLSNVSNSNLTLSNVTNSNLTGVNVSESNVSNNTITNSNLSGYNITNNNISNSFYGDINFTNEILTKNNYTNVTFTRVNVTGGQNISNQKFHNATINNVTLNNASVNASSVLNATLNDGTACYSNIYSSKLNNEEICFSNVFTSQIQGSNVTASNVSGGTINNSLVRQGSIVIGANVTNSNASYSAFIHSQLDSVNLSNVMLNGTNVSNSNLVNTSFVDVVITKTNVTGVAADNETSINEKFAPVNVVFKDSNITLTKADKGKINVTLDILDKMDIVNSSVIVATTNSGEITANVKVNQVNYDANLVVANSTSGRIHAILNANRSIIKGNATGAHSESGAVDATLVANNSIVEGNLVAASTNSGSATGRLHFQGEIKGDIIAAQSQSGAVKGSLTVGGAVSAKNVIAAKTQTGNADGNELIINGGQSSNNNITLYGGLVESGTKNNTANRNTVNVTYKVDWSEATLYGGRVLNGGQDVAGADAKRGNTLNIFSTDNSFKDIKNFEFINFYLPSTFVVGQPAIRLYSKEAVDFNGVKFGVGNLGENPALAGTAKKTTTFTLVESQNSELKLDKTIQWSYLDSISERFNININKEGSQKLVMVATKEVAEEQKVIFESALAGALAVTSNLKVIEDMLNQANPSEDLTGGDLSLGALSFDSVKTTTGSYVKSQNFGLSVGFAKNYNDELFYGAFFEGGFGSYDTFNDFASGELNGEGSSTHYGLGGFVKALFGDDYDNQIQASVRVGMLSNKFDATLNEHNAAPALVANDVDMSGMYYGASATYSRNLYTWERGKLWAYFGGAYTNLAGTDVEVGKDSFSIDAVSSFVLNLGARYTHSFDSYLGGFVKLGLEQELMGESDGTNNRNNYAVSQYLDMPSFKGTTGVTEFGVSYRAKENGGFVIDLSLKGLFGKNSGFGGNVKANYRF